MNTSKQITGRDASCQKVKSAYDKFGAKIVLASDQRFGPGTGEKVTAAIGLAVGQMLSDRDRLLNSEAALSGEREEGLQATSERDRCADLVRVAMAPLRGTCELVFGTEYARRIGFTGSTPLLPQPLYHYAAGILGEMKKVSVPPPVLSEVTADLLALAARLETPVELLRRAIEACGDERRDSDLAQTAKDAALTSYDQSFKLAASLISAWLEFSGERELARRVRPSARRPGNTAEVAGEVEDEPQNDAPAAGPAPEPAEATTAANG